LLLASGNNQSCLQFALPLLLLPRVFNLDFDLPVIHMAFCINLAIIVFLSSW